MSAIIPAITCAGIEGALVRLRGDLVSALDGGVPRGAVGAIDARGRALYGYPEAAGYWLQWASGRDEMPSERGEQVVEWLVGAEHANGSWPTRLGDGGDHSVHTGYLFDHAMLWYGLRRWGILRHSPLALRLAERVLAATQRYSSDNGLVASHGPTPMRWSGCVGPFLLKACARLRHARGPIADLCANAVPVLTQQCLSTPHAEAHPQLYAIEGLIVMGQTVAARAALAGLLTSHRGPLGVRETTFGGPRRSDIMAQTLRAALMLGVARRDEPSWSRLAAELVERVDEIGRVAFSDHDRTNPTWAGLFFEQALTLWSGGNVCRGELV